MTGILGKPHNEELHDLHILKNVQDREDEIGRIYSTNGEEEECI
jgi:hypothetical protein